MISVFQRIHFSGQVLSPVQIQLYIFSLCKLMEMIFPLIQGRSAQVLGIQGDKLHNEDSHVRRHRNWRDGRGRHDRSGDAQILKSLGSILTSRLTFMNDFQKIKDNVERKIKRNKTKIINYQKLHIDGNTKNLRYDLLLMRCRNG